MKQKYKYTVREQLLELVQSLDCGSLLGGKKFQDTLVSNLLEKVEVKWCPKIDEYYFFLYSDWEIEFTLFHNNYIDQFRIKTGNCFPYTEEGEKQVEEYKQKLLSLGGTK